MQISSATVGPYIGTAVHVPEDSDAMFSTKWGMRLGQPMLGEHGTLAEAKDAARIASGGAAPAVAIVKEGDVYRPYEVDARYLEERGTSWGPWAFADEDGVQLFLSTRKHADAAGVVAIIDVDRRNEWITDLYAGTFDQLD